MARETTMKGKKLMLFLNDKTVALSTGCTVTVNASYTEGATKDDGSFAKKTLDTLSLTISNTALMCESDAVTKSSAKLLLSKMKSGAEVEFSVCVPSNYSASGLPEAGWAEGTDVLISGKVVIDSVSLDAPVSGDASINVSLSNSGEFTFATA